MAAVGPSSPAIASTATSYRSLGAGWQQDLLRSHVGPSARNLLRAAAGRRAAHAAGRSVRARASAGWQPDRGETDGPGRQPTVSLLAGIGQAGSAARVPSAEPTLHRCCAPFPMAKSWSTSAPARKSGRRARACWCSIWLRGRRASWRPVSGSTRERRLVAVGRGAGREVGLL